MLDLSFDALVSAKFRVTADSPVIRHPLGPVIADFFGVSVDYLVGRTDSYPDGTEAFDAEMSAEKRFLLETVKSADEDTVHALASVAKAISRH